MSRVQWRRLLLSLWALLLIACESPPAIISTPTDPVQVTPSTMRMACSEAIAPVVHVLVSTYQRTSPETQIRLIVRADTLAFAALEAGDVDVALQAWLPASIPDGTWGRAFARDGLAIVVNPQNGLPGLTLDQLQELFQGQVEDWAPWGGLPGAPIVVSREQASGDFAAFQAWVMREVRVSLNARLAPSTEAVLSLVDASPLAVGYVSTARLDYRVRPLAVDGVPPALETLGSQHYPLTRDLYVLSKGDPQGPARDFTQWLLSPAGQEIIQGEGLIPAQVSP